MKTIRAARVGATRDVAHTPLGGHIVIPCKTDPDLHFDDKRAPEATRMCRACPAREACLALALDMESGQEPM